MIRGIPETFLVLGGFTVLSTIIFSKLKRGDGGNVSQQRVCTVGEYPISIQQTGTASDNRPVLNSTALSKGRMGRFVGHTEVIQQRRSRKSGQIGVSMEPHFPQCDLWLVSTTSFKYRARYVRKTRGNCTAPLSPWLYSLGSSVVRSGPCRHRRRVQCR